MKSILDVGPNDCRTVLTAPTEPVFMCAQPTAPGKKWCPVCYSKFYYKPTPRAVNAVEGLVAKSLKQNSLSWKYRGRAA